MAMDIVVHNKSSAYSGVITQFVNLARETPEFHRAHDNPHEYLAATGGMGDITIARFPRDLVAEARAQDDKFAHIAPDVRKEVLVEWLKAKHLSEHDALDLVDNLDEDAEGLDPAIIESLFDEDLGALRSAAFDLLEIQEMVRDPATVFLSRVSGLENQYETARRLGFQDLLYIEQFPMALVHAGYRRSGDVTSLPDSEVQLHDPDPRTGNYRVYAETFTTEAILFLLDRDRVAGWSADWTGETWDEGPLNMGFQAGCRGAMHAVQARECEEDAAVRRNNPNGHAVFTLVHSLSHAAIQAASTRSGFAANSLKEHMNIAGLAFAVTVNKNYPQSLGGLDALFQRGLDDFFRQMELGTRDCIQDPQCLHSTEAACYACLHLSEISCSSYNSHVDRRHLHGPPSGERAGFWQ